MAMIQCPSCKKQISDKISKCPYCGYTLAPEVKQICVKCGAELEDDATICPKCGCSVENIANTAEKDETTETKTRLINKKNLIVAVVIIVIGIIAIFVGTKIKEQNAIQSYNDSLELYENDLRTVTTTMLRGVTDAEICGNLLINVWRNAINEEEDPATNKYTRIPIRGTTSYYFTDFNTAIENLYSDPAHTFKIENIISNRETVYVLMAVLKEKDPPDEYEKEYDMLLEFYNEYIDLTDMVIAPDGSLQTFSSSFHDTDTKATDCYKTLAVRLDLR